MKFTKEFLYEMMSGGWDASDKHGPPYDKECELISERITRSDRWATYKEYIFKYDDHYYAFDFWRGSTEQQGYDKWSVNGSVNYQEEVDGAEVWPTKKAVTEYITHDPSEGTESFEFDLTWRGHIKAKDLEQARIALAEWLTIDGPASYVGDVNINYLEVQR